MMIAICVSAVVGVAAIYDLTHDEQSTQASASLQVQPVLEKRIAAGIAGEAAAREIIENVAQRPSTPIIEDRAVKKEDRLITGSLAKPNEIAPAKIDGKPEAKTAKKKPATATAKAGATGNFDIFGRGQTSSPPN